MASIYQLKPAFQNLLRPLVKQLATMGVTANQVTIFACLLSLLLGILVWFWPEEPALILVIPGFLFVRMALNAVDGLLAREHAMASPLGAILNELTDVISDAALYLPFCRISGFDARTVVAIVFLGALSEMTGVVATQIGASRRYDGPMGKSDRAFVFGLSALLHGLGLRLSPFLTPILIAVAFLAAFTSVNRARAALREVSS